MYMSVVSLPNIKHYWNRTLRIEAVAETMLRDRFLTINRLLHLSNNNLQPKKDEPGYERLYKIRPILTHLSETLSFINGILDLNGIFLSEPKTYVMEHFCHKTYMYTFFNKILLK